MNRILDAAGAIWGLGCSVRMLEEEFSLMTPDGHTISIPRTLNTENRPVAFFTGYLLNAQKDMEPKS